MTGDDSAPGHIVPEGALDLGHAATGTEERELELFLSFAVRLSGLVDRGVELAGQIGPFDVACSTVVDTRFVAVFGRSEAEFENDGVRYGASLGWPMRRPPSA